MAGALNRRRCTANSVPVVRDCLFELGDSGRTINVTATEVILIVP
jgi:hypothetical protein